MIGYDHRPSVDHVRRIEDGGGNDGNLQIVGLSCNLEKG